MDQLKEIEKMYEPILIKKLQLFEQNNNLNINFNPEEIHVLKDAIGEKTEYWNDKQEYDEENGNQTVSRVRIENSVLRLVEKYGEIKSCAILKYDENKKSPDDPEQSISIDELESIFKEKEQNEKNGFIEDVVNSAKTKVKVRKMNKEAKELLGEYEQMLPKDKETSKED